MSRKQGQAADRRVRGWRTPLRYTLLSAGALLLIASGLFVRFRVEQFLVTDPRFRLLGDPEPGLRIEGVVRCSREKVVDAFAPDFGRSIYLVPLDERRRSLLAIDWVRDAAVFRLWPDRLVVKIVERMPVAFVRIPAPAGGPSLRVALVDSEGVILDPPPRGQFNLPVLTGILPQQTLAMRRARVHEALRLVQELGPLADQVSEIDVLDPANLKITQPFAGRALVLMMGNRNFLAPTAPTRSGSCSRTAIGSSSARSYNIRCR